VVVDAIFGFGLNRTVEDPFCSVITTINRLANKVVAIDVPSGLDATTGKIHGVCIQANHTITFTAPKTGFFRREGPRMTGRVSVVGKR